MATSIGSLVIDMSANLGALKTDMAEAKNVVSNTMRDVQKSIDSAKSAMLALTGTLVGIGSIDAFKSMVQGVIDTKVELFHLSQQTGATVESLSAIAGVSKLTGTSLTDVGSAMNKLQKNLASSTEDSKGAAQAIKALGINFNDFVRMSPDQQMLKVAKAMDEFNDGGGKSAAAMLLFGKTGAQLLPMLKDLAEKNELVGKQSTESARQAEEFEKNLKKLQTTSGTLKREFVESLLPSLQNLTEEMLRAKKEGEGLFGMLAAGAKAWFNGTPEQQQNKAMFEATGKLIAAQRELAEISGSDSPMMQGRIKALQMIVQENEKIIAQVRVQKAITDPDNQSAAETKRINRKKELDPQLGVAASGSTGASDFDHFNKQTLEKIALDAAELSSTTKLSDAEKERAKFLQALDLAKVTDGERAMLKARYDGIFAMDKEVEKRKYLRELQDAELKSLEKGYEALDSYNDQVTKSLSDISFQTTLLGKDADAQRQLTEMRKLDIEAQKALKAANNNPELQQQILQQNADAQAKITAELVRQKKAQDDLNASWEYGATKALDDYLKAVKDVAGETGKAVTNAFKSMEDALVKFATTGKLDFKSLANSIIADIVRIQVQQNITGPLAQSIKSGGGFGGWLSSLFGGNMGSFGGGGITGDINTMGFGGTYAAGGNPPVGMPSLVGEKGPELFIPKTAGTIVPNSALGGSITYAPTFNIDSRTDRAAVYSDMVRITQQSQKAFADQLAQQGVLQR